MENILNEKEHFNYTIINISFKLAGCGGKDKPQETASSLC